MAPDEVARLILFTRVRDSLVHVAYCMFAGTYLELWAKESETRCSVRGAPMMTNGFRLIYMLMYVCLRSYKEMV